MLHSPLLDPSTPASAEAPAARLVRILVADDHDLVCAGLERIIATQPDMEVCASAMNGRDALEKAKRLTPDIAILDMEMRPLHGLDCTREIRKALPDCEVLLFTGIETDDLMRDAFNRGAKSFILKTDARAHLLAAIRSLARHKPYFTNKVSRVIFGRLLESRHNGGSPVSHSTLSPAEFEILKRLALGDTNRQMAENLGVNLRTAETRRAALMHKMEFASLADLVRYAVRNGIIEP